MISTIDMAEELVRWARDNENIRVVNLYSSRANPHATVDILSDYDVEVFVHDLHPFTQGEEWLAPFGQVMVRQPYNSSVWKDGGVGPMVLFKDGRRIDFNFRLLSELKKEIESGNVGSWNRVLLDKDDITRNFESMESHDDSEFWTKKPTKDEFAELTHHFWWNITYVAKYLYRDEFLLAKRTLDVSLHHHYLKTILSWYLGVRKNWQNNPGQHGRWIRKELDPDLWREVESTFAGASLDDNWRAMFKTAEIFGRLASLVGDALGYPYPATLDREVTEYLLEIRRLTD